jgi:PE family
MSFVIARPEALAGAAGDLDVVASALAAQNLAAAAVTAGLPPAAADEVSALTATQFSAHAALYQAAGAQAVAVHELFIATLSASAGSYAATEVANTIAAS